MDFKLGEPYASLHIIDSDSHWNEPLDLWTKRAPSRYVDSMPHVVLSDQGKQQWVINDTVVFRAAGASFVKDDGRKIRAASVDLSKGLTQDDAHPASSDPKARVELLDELGIYAQIVYPNVLGFAAPGLVQLLDRELAYAIVRIYNDACAEWQEESGERLFPQAVLPFWNIADSVEEAARVKALGLRGVTMAGNPHMGGLPDLGQPDWDPLYEALTDLELPINIHVGAVNHDASQLFDAAWPSLSRRAAASVNPVQMELANSRFIANLVVSDVLIRWPELKWVSVESGVGWIPYVLERVDYGYREEFEGEPPADRPPAIEMFRKNIFACFWFEETAARYLIERLGADSVMWETDFPHPTCLYPSPVERAAATMSHLSDETIRKVMQDNATKLYKIELPAT